MNRLVIGLVTGMLAFSASAGAKELKPSEVEARDLFKQVVEIPTVEGRGEVPRLVKLLSEKFRAEGFDDIIVKPHGETETMILRWKAGGTPIAKPILLMAHMDVVEAKRDDWADDPFIFREKDGYYWGRGSVDNKAGMTAIVMSLIRLKRSGFAPKRDIIVLFTGDEETAGDGSRLAASEWIDLVRAEYALNSDAGGGGFTADGTPLGYGMQTAEKTYRTYTFSVTNKGGHSSKPRPDNAIYELASAITRLEKHRFAPMLNETTRGYFAARAKQEKGALGDAMRRWLADDNDGEAADIVEADPKEVGLTRTRCVATKLAGGHADNALPQLAQATVNCRIFPGVDPVAVKAELEQIAGEGVAVEQSDSFGASTPASPLRADVVGAYTKAIQKRFPDMPIVPSMSTGATDGVFFRGIGIPVYGVSGIWLKIPEDARAHGLDERIPVESFHMNIGVWEDMLRELAG
ncbi:M20/M25/M40 family metallo-hydrolase [Parasphingorhabdus halotolerans]|uniref:M20/M25/M40 family metallo-hydrolase n=1 Tax=Parasphingorhabdus halotolerans TaxID=2725558 RepID=A0A6H2DP86_9SPHN|nr:M20/M25/M40 family metallo-hydrolase [Parasphingorhabdus halotolerans]QJB69571.1 M20/M25/M40 family metallo-hydrolase [Parasphingorhabdus halotolerans]